MVKGVVLGLYVAYNFSCLSSTVMRICAVELVVFIAVSAGAIGVGVVL